MIPDGYNEYGEINGDLFIYRPLKRQDRWALSAELERLPDRLAEKLEHQIVESRIVVCDWGCSVSDFDDETYEQLWRMTLGVGRDQQEIDDEENLFRGVELLVRFPWMEQTTCGQCRMFQWKPLTGGVNRQTPDGPVLRREGGTLCDIPSKEFRPASETACPRGHWSSPIGLSPKNALAWKHYQACEATGFPDDPLVSRNGRIIRDAIESARSHQKAGSRTVGRGVTAGQLRHPQERRRGAGGNRAAGRTGGRGSGIAGRPAAGLAAGGHGY